MKIVTVVGARPQFIKASVLSRAFAEDNAVDELLVNTGQHYDDNMAGIFFEQLGLPVPHVNLGIGSGPHGRQTGEMLSAVEKILLKSRPDAMLVYGDTNSTLAGALAAAKLNIPIAHVEAGLRSFNRRMPEEINRVLTDHSSHWLFTPTATARDNLLREGLPAERIFEVGDIMLDVARAFVAGAERASTILESVGLVAGQYVLATIHRAENTDSTERLQIILRALAATARSIPVVLPIHPRTRAALRASAETEASLRELRVIDPVGFLDMLVLESNAALVATDSGGVQKEAFFHGVPCVTLREETEWVELVELGWNRLAPPTSEKSIRETINAALGSRGVEAAPYGDGTTAQQIKRTLLAHHAG